MSIDVSIVIPIYNALPLAKQCLASIWQHGSGLAYEVILVDNGSAPDVEAWANAEVAEHTNLRYLRYDQPLGFARSVNIGAAEATGTVLIVLNSDTLVTPQWMEGLHAALLADPSLGALSPYTNHAGDAAQIDFATVDMPADKALALVARRGRQPELFYLPQRITFFCVALRRDLWQAFGGLDEAYEVGNFEDDDLCLRLRVQGYRLAVAKHVYVYHHNNATFSANKISHGGWMTRNARTFAEHAAAFAEADPAELNAQRRFPRRSLVDISVVLLPGNGSLDRTLRSLANQTIVDFEILEPGSAKTPAGSWIAYLQQGDIAFPFHLEALHDALHRNAAEAIYADCWVQGAASSDPHPDSAGFMRSAPLFLAGWMHHASLRPDAAYDETAPIHWPRLTWEVLEAPAIDTSKEDAKPAFSLVETARDFYRKHVSYQTRINLDSRVRKLLGRSLPDVDTKQLQDLTAALREQIRTGVDRNAFAVDNSLPAIFMFNGMGWNDLTQRHHHFARNLAELGHTVFWIENRFMNARYWHTSRRLPELANNIHMVRLPSTEQNIYSITWNEATLEAMSEALVQTCAAYGITNAVSLVNYPRWQPLVDRMRTTHGWAIANDYIDDNTAFSKLYQTIVADYDKWLVDNADLLITSAVVLQKIVKRPSVLLHNACDFEYFTDKPSSGKLDDCPRPIIGFFGAKANWLDLDLIHSSAKRFPEWTFVYIGPVTFSHPEIEAQWLRATDLPNVRVIPQMEFIMLPRHLTDFDVCIMPFKDYEATHAMNCVKLYEYLAAGKPAVARDLPETRYMVDHEAQGLLYLYRSEAEYFELLQTAVNENDPALRERRKDFARHNDWKYRVAELSRLLIELASKHPIH